MTALCSAYRELAFQYTVHVLRVHGAFHLLLRAAGARVDTYMRQK